MDTQRKTRMVKVIEEEIEFVIDKVVVPAGATIIGIEMVDAIDKEEFDKLSYEEQEKYLVRCFACQLKLSPFDALIDKEGRKYCSSCCLDENVKLL